MKTLIILLSIILGLYYQSYAQDGPGSIGSTDGNSSLKMWLKASDLLDEINEGALVLNWKDNSGSDNHLKSTSQTAPTFEKNDNNPYIGVRFQGNEYLQTIGTSSDFSPTESTIFVVTSGLNTGASIAIAANAWFNEMLLFKQRVYHHSSSGNFSFLSIDCVEFANENELSISCGIYGKIPDDINYYYNGIKATNEIETAGGGGQEFTVVDRKVTIGQRDEFVPSEFYKGYIYEVIVYNRKLDEDEIFQVEEYLRCRYCLFPICEDLNDSDCCITSTIDQNEGFMELSIFPNPTSDILNISMNYQGNKGELKYSILNLLGQEMIKAHLNNDISSIDISYLEAGVYFFKIQEEDQYSIQKFIVE